MQGIVAISLQLLSSCHTTTSYKTTPVLSVSFSLLESLHGTYTLCAATNLYMSMTDQKLLLTADQRTSGDMSENDRNTQQNS